jgi:hypothetical protein
VALEQLASSSPRKTKKAAGEEEDTLVPVALVDVSID